MKKTFYTEAAYILGLIALAAGAALMEAADFGVSMVVAPAYLLHLKVSQYFPFFTFGMAEYTLQAVLLILMMLILRRFKTSYLFSIVTAILYGFILDGLMVLVAYIPSEHIMVRILFYIIGLIFCSMGVSLLFHTYIAPEAYELFVKELSAKYHINIHKFKTGFDCIFCLIGVSLSFAFFGLWQFEGVKPGTILCALVNGWFIGRFTHVFEKNLDFKDAFCLRKFF